MQYESGYHCSSKLEVYCPVLTETGQSSEQMGDSLTENNDQVWSPVQRKAKQRKEERRKTVIIPQ